MCNTEGEHIGSWFFDFEQRGCLFLRLSSLQPLLFYQDFTFFPFTYLIHKCTRTSTQAWSLVVTWPSAYCFEFFIHQ